MDTISRLMAITALVALTCSCTNDVLDATYATRAEAVSAGAIKRGWIPSWIPPEASSLNEVHNVDTNESVLAFRLPANFTWSPPASSCRPVNAGQFYEPSFSREWIPETLDDYDFYSCPQDITTGGVPVLVALAVRNDGQYVLHWRNIAP